MTLLGVLKTAALVVPAILGCTSRSRTVSDVDGRRLTPAVDSFAAYLIRGTDTTRIGAVVDAVTIRDLDGRQVIQRVYSSEDQLLGVRLDSLIDDVATLAPIRHRSRGSAGLELLEFSGQRVTGVVHEANADSIRVDMPLERPVFNGSSFDLVIRASALAEGWSAVVPAFVVGRQAVESLKARVAGVEVIRGDRCWRVDAEFIGMPVTFWISQSDRRLRQQVMHPRPDLALMLAR